MQAAGSKHAKTDEDYTRHKRMPPRLPQQNNEVYISEKSNFKAQETKCQKLLDSGNEVIIHGLGKAVNRAVNLALQLKDRGQGTVQISAQTSTVDIVDDLLPETDEGEAKTSVRSNSAIHIRVYRPELAEAPQATSMEISGLFSGTS